MNDLTAFLFARIAEDEADARAAYPGGRWQVVTNPYHGHSIKALDVHAHELPDYPETVFDDEGGALPPDVPTMHHIARWDPARVIAECDAKRRIVAEHAMSPFPTLALLALPYADHPNYDQSWRP